MFGHDKSDVFYMSSIQGKKLSTIPLSQLTIHENVPEDVTHAWINKYNVRENARMVDEWVLLNITKDDILTHVKFNYSSMSNVLRDIFSNV